MRVVRPVGRVAHPNVHVQQRTLARQPGGAAHPFLVRRRGLVGLGGVSGARSCSDTAVISPPTGRRCNEGARAQRPRSSRSGHAKTIRRGQLRSNNVGDLRSFVTLSAGKRNMDKPLLVIDGDSFAHRALHGLPKSIRRTGNRGGGAIEGFANFLLRLFEIEQPRAVLVGWDTLELAKLPATSLPGLPKRSGFRPGAARAVAGAACVCPPRAASRTQRPQVTRPTTFSPQPSPRRNVGAELCS